MQKQVRWFGSPPLDAKQEDVFFVTDGTNNPSEFSGQVLSVTRLTGTGSGTPEFYRVALRTTREDRINFFGASAAITFVAGDNLIADVTRDLSTTPATNLALESATAIKANEFDVLVRDPSTGTATNQVAAGRFVSVLLLWDAGKPRR